MSDRNGQPKNLCFDDTSGFAENCSDFIARIEPIDPEMTSILRDNWDCLLAVVREGTRDSKARNAFNTAISIALDSFVVTNQRKSGA